MEKNGEPGEVVYRETVPYAPWVQIMIYCMIALFAVVFAFFLVSGHFASSLLFGIVTVFLALLWMNFRHLEFLVTEGEVEFGFGVIRKRFSRSALLSCEPYELRFKNYLGYGIRLGFDGTIAYNTRNGRGIKMVVEGLKRPYVIPVDDPGKVCDLLSGGGPPDQPRGRNS